MGKPTVFLQPTWGSPPPPAPAPPPHVYASQDYSEPVPPPPMAAEPRYVEPDRPTRVPMGVFLLDRIVNGTVGSLTVDLKRPQIPRTAARSSLFTINRNAQGSDPYQRTAPMVGYGGSRYRTRGRAPRQMQEQRQRLVDSTGYIPNQAFANTGARIKVMRHIQFGPEHTYTRHGRTFTAPQFDFGFGGDFEFDTAEFTPKLRLKLRDVASIQALPFPALKIQRRVQLGTSGFGIRLSYECPIESLNRFYAPPARLLLTLDNAVDNGLKLTQSGVELSVNQWLWNGNARIKAAGVMHMPSELPIDEDQMLFRFEAKRLGFKTRW